MKVGKTLTILALAGILLDSTGCNFPERFEQRGIVDYIGFVKNSQSIERDSISDLNIFNQSASGGGFLSGGGRIGDSRYSGDVVIRMSPLDDSGKTKMLYLKDDGIGMPASVLLDYLSMGDTITLGEYSTNEYFDDNTFFTLNPEQVSKVGN